ncbi:hypothetical protein [Shewanella sp. TB7-MNA-CIBAN-0143]|uniref:hypothetical protein n=1 Tax=Shewanella sp. TB7-MNA-CIBAN-0143 TaxID=3140465 RepID=UPI00331FA125
MKQHKKIGLSIEAAEKANPFVAITIAKKAAQESHVLLGGLIGHTAKLEARINKLEAINND